MKMSKATFVGIDAGNKNLKVLVDGHDDPVIVPNILANVREYKSFANIGMFKKQPTNPINCLDLTIITNGRNLGRKYVGNAAIRYGGEERPLNKDKYNDDDILFSSLAGIAFAMYDAVNPVKTVNIGLGTCLPTEESLEKDRIIEHEKRFIGTHEVIFHDSVFNGAKITIKIANENITTGPEGTIALFNMMTDRRGNLLQEYTRSEDELYIVTDIGGGTTDVSAVMNFSPIEELIDSFDMGILHAEELIIRKLRSINRNYVISRPELDFNIRKANYDLLFGKETVNIKEFVNEEFTELWEYVAEKLNNMIQLVPVNLKRYIKGIILTGGSSVLLEKYVSKNIAGYDVTLSKAPLKDNVEGCLKAIKILQRAKEAASGEDEIYTKE